jgi:type IV secretion system protein VirB4
MKLSSQKLAKLDPRAGDRLPYAGHVNDHTLATRTGELIQMIQIDGIAFETADSETLNHMAAVRDVVMRGIANSNLMLYCHVIRRRVAAELSTPQPEGFARDLDAAWQERLRGKQLYINDIILMLVRRPARGKVGFVERLTKWGSGKRSPEERLAEQARELRELDSARTNLLSALSRYGPRVLERYQGASGICSEPLEILSALYNGEMQPLLEPTGDAGHYLPYKRISFGLDALHLKGSSAETSRFGAIVSIKDYPATTSPGMLDNLLRLPHELTLTESFAFVDRQIADERIGLALRRLRAASDETTTLRQGLLGAKDELTGGAAAYGEHHLSVHVRAGSLPALDAAVADVQASLADIGAVSVREDLNLESAFWGQFPGNAEFIARKALVSTANLSGLISLHGFPIGAPAGPLPCSKPHQARPISSTCTAAIWATSR